MKTRSLIIAITLTALIFSLFTETKTDKTAKGVMDIPSSPNNKPLKIHITSPTYGQNFNTQNLTINFTITKPASWYQYSLGPTGKVLWVDYSLDEGNFTHISIDDSDREAPRVLNLSLDLTNLSLGSHMLKVGACGRSYSGGFPPTETDIEVYTNVIFKIEELPNPVLAQNGVKETEFPILITASIGIIAVGSIVILVYNKNKRRS